MDSRTRALTLSYVQFSSGFRADLASIGQLCRERGAYFVVDMIQGVGAMPLDVQETPFDIGAADGHKWLLGPEGIGYLYCREEVLDDLAPVHVGWHSVTRAYDFDTYDFTLRPGAVRFEEGSPNMIGAVGLGASVALLLEWSIPAAFARVMELTSRIIDQAQRRGYEILTPIETEDERSGIVIFRLPGQDAKALVAALEEKKVLAAARGGGIRFSPHAYNTVEEIDEAFEVVDSAMSP
jgi:selenocysteine lyase/cysteine desulfurase